jgi:predicted dehydrogenase
MKPLRLGLLGRGPWAKNIERTLLSFDDVAVLPIARGEASPANLDAVVIATSSASHADVALPFIEKGIPAFIEKPMATSVADAERIKYCAERSDALVFVGHIYLFNPAFHRVLDVLPALGPIKYLICEGANNRPRHDSSIFWDWLPHHLSMARAIFGMDGISVSAWNLSTSPNAEAAVAKFSFAGTPVLSLASSVSPVKRRLVTIACETGTLIFDDAAERKLTLYRDEMDVSYLAYGADLPLTLEMRAFVDTVRSGRGDRSQLETGAAIVRMIAAAETSAKIGGATVDCGQT